MKLICNVFGCRACAWLLDAMGIQSFKTFHLFASLFFFVLRTDVSSPLLLSSLFLLLFLQPLIWRDYRGDVGVEEIDKFLPLVLEVEEEGTMCPIVSSGGKLPCRHSRQAHTLTLTFIHIYLRLPSYVADLCKHSRPRAVYSFWHFLFVGLDARRTVCVANRNIIPCI